MWYLSLNHLNKVAPMLKPHVSHGIKPRPKLGGTYATCMAPMFIPHMLPWHLGMDLGHATWHLNKAMWHLSYLKT
jgi:hypothetical protein